jgi:hypothetical protein
MLKEADHRMRNYRAAERLVDYVYEEIHKYDRNPTIDDVYKTTKCLVEMALASRPARQWWT